MSRNYAIGLEAALECELDGQPVTVTAREGVIVVNVASSEDVRSMFRIARSLGGLRWGVARVNDAVDGAAGLRGLAALNRVFAGGAHAGSWRGALAHPAWVYWTGRRPKSPLLKSLMACMMSSREFITKGP